MRRPYADRTSGTTYNAFTFDISHRKNANGGTNLNKEADPLAGGVESTTSIVSFSNHNSQMLPKDLRP